MNGIEIVESVGEIYKKNTYMYNSMCVLFCFLLSLVTPTLNYNDANVIRASVRSELLNENYSFS